MPIRSVRVASTWLVVLWAALAAAAASAESIVVTVVDSAGKPLSGEKIFVFAPEGQVPVGFKTTDAEGRATVTVDRAGDYTVVLALDRRDGSTFVVRKVVATKEGAPVRLNSSHNLSGPDGYNPATADVILSELNAAADACDRARYEAAMGRFETYEASSERWIQNHRGELAAGKRRWGLPDVATMGDVRRAIARAEASVKAGVASEAAVKLVEKKDEVLKDLEGKFGNLRRAEEAREAARRARANIKELRTSCGPGLGTTEFFASLGGGPSHLQRPGGAFFRTEAGGVVLGFPALRFGNDRTVLNLDGALGARFRTGVFGATREVTVELRGWHMDSRGDADLALFTPPGGATTGLFSPTAPFAPFGGYFTGSPLSDIRYRSTFQEFGGTLTAAVAFNAGGVTIAPFAGVRLARSTVDDKLSMGIGNPAFTTFEQRSDIGATAFGPLVGASVKGDIGGGFYGFGAASAGLSFARARGQWQTFVPLVDPEARVGRLSGAKTAYQLDATAGVGFKLDGLSIEMAARVSHGNGSPHLAFASPDGTADGTGGARVGFARQTTLGLTARGVVVF